MTGNAALGLGALALLVAFPFGLLAAVWGLAALERWMLSPTEKAAEVERLLALEDVDTIEDAVAELLAGNADTPGRRVVRRRVRTSLAFKKFIRQSEP
jgi:hypothetical protein